MSYSKYFTTYKNLDQNYNFDNSDIVKEYDLNEIYKEPPVLTLDTSTDNLNFNYNFDPPEFYRLFLEDSPDLLLEEDDYLPFIDNFINFNVTPSTDVTYNSSNNPETYTTSLNGTFSDKQDFIHTLNDTYREVLKEEGLDPNYSYVLTASAAMESGWGTKVSGTFNYGGVKAGKNVSGTNRSTTDYVNGLYIKRNLKFRNFPSVKDYCTYVVNLLLNERYGRGFELYSASQPLEFWRYILDAGYGGGDSNHKADYISSIGRIITTIKATVNKNNSSSQTSQQQMNTTNSLLNIDIEDLLKLEGITSVNSKPLKFGRRELRPKDAKYGSKNSYHYVWNPNTQSANARDISIQGGTLEDYDKFRLMLLNNQTVVNWMKANNWGIINEVTEEIRKKTGGTGPHFHFGPDTWARRTWTAWLQNPNIPITTAV